MSPRGATLVALLCLAGQGCDADVVDFPLKGQVPDLYPGACKIVVDSKISRRCVQCPGQGADAWTESCEDMVCKLTSIDAGGGATCKDCFWENHPGEKCQLCWDARSMLTRNTCQGKDLGS